MAAVKSVGRNIVGTIKINSAVIPYTGLNIRRVKFFGQQWIHTKLNL
jgi:hypothetical protein